MALVACRLLLFATHDTRSPKPDILAGGLAKDRVEVRPLRRTSLADCWRTGLQTYPKIALAAI